MVYECQQPRDGECPDVHPADNIFVSVGHIVNFMNELARLTPITMNDLVNIRTFCNYQVRKSGKIDPVLVGQDYDTPTMGMLEVINGMIKPSGYRVEAVAGRDGLKEFKLTCQ